MSLFEHLAEDALAARAGDPEATYRLARRGLPWLAKRVLPGGAGPVVDAACGVVDYFVRPEVTPPEVKTSFDTVGAGRFKAWLKRLDHGLIVVVGATGTGKTTLLCKLADIWSGKSHRYIVGVDAAACEGTPLEPIEWDVKKLARLPRRSVLLVPDSGLYLDSRDHGSHNSPEQVVRELAQIARHREIIIALDVQYTSLLAKSAFLARALIYKPLGVTWRVTEREGLIGLARKSQEAFNTEIPADERIRYAYVFSDETDFEGFVSIDPPEWYSQAISTSHGGPTVEGEWREVEDDGEGG